MRLDKGITEAEDIFEKYIKINEEKAEALKNIFSLTKSLENTSLKLEQSEHDEEYQSMKKGMNKNIDTFFNLYEKNRLYCNKLSINIQEQLRKYHIEVSGLKEIFDRKDKLEISLKKLRNEELTEDRAKEMIEIENLFQPMHEQLIYELNCFKNYREKDLLVIMKTFFKEKLDFDTDVKTVYDIGAILNDKGNDFVVDFEGNDNHFD